MNLTEMEQELFAVLFASGVPLESVRLCEALDVTEYQLSSCVKALQLSLEKCGIPLDLRELGDSLQLCTKSSFKEIITKALDLKRNVPLTPAAMEVLAIIAYNQPVTKGFIEQIRGVDSSTIVGNLVKNGLLEEDGRLDLPGRPIAFKTTPVFLRCFSMSSIDDLPKIDTIDLEELKEEERNPMQLSFDMGETE